MDITACIESLGLKWNDFSSFLSRPGRKEAKNRF